MLKLQFPDEDSQHEAHALAHWDGAGRSGCSHTTRNGARCWWNAANPAPRCTSLPLDRALDAAIDLLPRLWRPAGAPFTPLAEEAAGWIDRMPRNWDRAGRPYERRLLDEALALLGGLASSQGEQVLVNQDLHAGNVLAADREPWLAIDPKPLTGEREFSVVPMVRGRELGHSPAAVRHRLDRLSVELGLDRERVRGWTIGHTLAWSIADEVVFPHQIEVVRWLLDEA